MSLNGLVMIYCASDTRPAIMIDEFNGFKTGIVGFDTALCLDSFMFRPLLIAAYASCLGYLLDRWSLPRIKMKAADLEALMFGNFQFDCITTGSVDIKNSQKPEEMFRKWFAGETQSPTTSCCNNDSCKTLYTGYK